MEGGRGKEADKEAGEEGRGEGGKGDGLVLSQEVELA